MEIKQYSPAAKYGVTIGSAEVINGGLASSSVPGTALDTLSNLGSVAVNTNGATAVPFFPGSNTSPIMATITSVCITCTDTTKGTIDLISDQGTLVRLIKSGTANGLVGSFINPIVVQVGSLLKVISAGTDNATFEATFYTFA